MWRKLSRRLKAWMQGVVASLRPRSTEACIEDVDLQSRELAYHEAAHYVIGYGKGMLVGDLTIVPHGIGLASADVRWDSDQKYHIENRVIDAPDSDKLWSAYYVVAAAGRVAQMRVSQRPPVEANLADDNEKMRISVECLTKIRLEEPNIVIEQQDADTNRLVDKHWDKIEELARALLEKKTLLLENALQIVDPTQLEEALKYMRAKRQK